MAFPGFPDVASHLLQAALPAVDAVPAAGNITLTMLTNARLRSGSVASMVGVHGPDGTALATVASVGQGPW